MEFVSPIVSITALCVSLFTAWFTILRRGTVRSTQPSFIAFRYDFVGKSQPQAKIFLRTLLFSTGKRGIVIEHLYLRVKEGSRLEEFSFWGYGDKELVRGSGMFVSENGIVTYHHFNPINSDNLFLFKSGNYELELVAKLINRKNLIILSKIAIELPSGAFEDTISPETAIYCNWSSEKQHYIVSVEEQNSKSQIS